MPISPQFQQLPKPNNKFLRLLAELALPSNPVEGAMDLAGPMMAVERVGGKVVKGLMEEAIPVIKKEISNFKPSDLVPAIKVENKVFTGTHHGEAMEKAMSEGVLASDWSPFDQGINVDLFQLPDGTLIDRFEANRLFKVTAAENIPGNKIKPSAPKKTPRQIIERNDRLDLLEQRLERLSKDMESAPSQNQKLSIGDEWNKIEDMRYALEKDLSDVKAWGQGDDNILSRVDALLANVWP